MNPLPNDTHLCPPLSNTLPRVGPPLNTVFITRFLAFFVRRLSVIFAFAILQVSPVLGQNRIAEELLKTAKTGSVFIKHSQGTGTGFFVGKDGVIATNFHVVSPIAFEKDGIPKFSTLTNLSVVVNSGESDEQTYSARILNFDMKHDLALLKIDARAAPLPLGDATKLHETSDLWAFGFPLGEDAAYRKGNPEISVNHGAVTSLRKNQEKHLKLIQSDIALNPGNSGGPVLDANGMVVGISVAGRTDAAGITYLVPANYLAELLKQGQEWKGSDGKISLNDLAFVCLNNKNDANTAFKLITDYVFWQPTSGWQTLRNHPGLAGLAFHKDYQRLIKQDFSASVQFGLLNDDIILISNSGHPLTNVFIFVDFVENGQHIMGNFAGVEGRWNPNGSIKMKNFASLKKKGAFVTQFTIHLISDQYICTSRWAGLPGSGAPQTKADDSVKDILREWGLGNAMYGAGACRGRDDSTYLSAPQFIPETIDKGDKLALVARMAEYNKSANFYIMHTGTSTLMDTLLTLTATDDKGIIVTDPNKINFWSPGALVQIRVPLTRVTKYSIQIKGTDVTGRKYEQTFEAKTR